MPGDTSKKKREQVKSWLSAIAAVPPAIITIVITAAMVAMAFLLSVALAPVVVAAAAIYFLFIAVPRWCISLITQKNTELETRSQAAVDGENNELGTPATPPSLTTDKVETKSSCSSTFFSSHDSNPRDKEGGTEVLRQRVTVGTVR